MATTKINAAQQFNSTADWSASGYKITNVVAPISATDAANKGYVDAVSAGLDPKASVRAVTTGTNITLSGIQTIDTVALSANDRVLIKDQSTASQNGIYIVASGAWSRSTDANTSTLVPPGMFVFVTEGTQAATGWVLATAAPITLGSTSLSFVQFSGAGEITNGNGIAKSGNTLSVQTNSSARITVGAGGIDLATTTVSANSYGTSGFKVPYFTVDNYGRLTAAAEKDLFGSTTMTANYIFAGPSSGSAAAATFRALVFADMISGLVQGATTSTVPTNGQLLIGNTTNSNFSLTALTQGTGITITNAAGSITVAASASLQSVGGLTWSSGSPLVKMTAAGTFGLDTNTYITSAGTATNFSGSLSGDVTGSQSSTAISNATVVGKLLTGYSSTTGTISSSTSIVSAISILNGNLAAATAGGITAVSVVTANGVSGTSSGGATPALTISLGVITPTSVNGLTLAALSTGFTVAGGTTSKTLTVSNTLTLAGTDSSTLNIGTGGTLGTAAYTASSAYQAASSWLTSIAGLTWSSGSPLVKMTASGTFGLDTNTYITSAGTATNFSGSLSGDVTGNQGSTAIAASTVTGKALTGLGTATGTILATDSILIGFNKVVGNSALYALIAGQVFTGNIAVPNVVEGFTTTATSGGSVTLTVSSNYNQTFTGSLTHTVVLPIVSTLSLGFSFLLTNQSTGAITVNSSGSNPVIVLAPGTSAIVVCQLITGTTAASWQTTYVGSVVTSGKVLTVSNTLTLSGTDASTLNIGTGGTLGTAAYTASSAYQATSSALTSVAGLSWSSGTPHVTMTATGTFGLDTAIYITSAGTSTNFSGSLSGDVTGTQSSTAISAATVTGKLITGFVSGAATVAVTDTILQAINKLDGNTAAKQASSSNLTSLAGLSYVSASFVKMTGANTFTLDTNTYLTSTTGLLATGATTGATSQAQAFTNGVKTGLIYPSSDSTTAVKVTKADGSTAVMTVDTTNSKITVSGGLLINTSGTAELFNTFHDATYSVGRNIWIGGGGQSSAGTSGHTNYGADMVSLGHGAFQAATQSYQGVAIGSGAAGAVTGTTGITVVGANSFIISTVGTGTTLLGANIMSNTTATVGGDTAVGVACLYYATTTGYNTIIGAQGGSVASDGSTPIYTITNCVTVGANIRSSADSVTNEIIIGYSAIGSGSNTVTLGNSSITKTVLQGTVTFNNGNLLMNNVAATYASYFTNTNTAARIYTLPDRALTIDNITTSTTTTGTGFLKGNGSVISFDGTTYVNIAKLITRENPAVTPNGVTTAYPLANLVVTGTEQVYVNGLLQRGGSNDYAVSNAAVTTVTFQTGSIPQAGDYVQVTYISQ